MKYSFMNIDWTREELEEIQNWAATIGYQGKAKELKHAVELNLAIVQKLNDALAEPPNQQHTDNEQGDKRDNLNPV